jgi:hypothetical protein
LDLLEESAATENILSEAIDGGLHCTACCLRNTLQVIVGHSTSAEDVSISEVLGRQIADGEFGEHYLSPSVDDLLQLLVDELPLGIHDRLVIIRVIDTDLGVLLLALQLQLHVQQTHIGVLEAFRLLLEPSVREGFLESDAINKERFLICGANWVPSLTHR